MAGRVTRRPAKKRGAQLAFEALSIEGGLLSPEWLGKVAQLAAGQQSETDYGIKKGLNLRDELGRYWRIAQAEWAEFDAGRRGGGDPAQLSRKFIEALLKDCFGFASLAASEPMMVAERIYPVRLQALGGRVPVVIAPAALGLDTPTADFGDGSRKRSAFGLAQEYINASDPALWGLATDGLSLRIVRDNASLTRPAWIEVDLARLFAETRYADFTALWLLMHESRFGRADQLASDCALEAWRTAGREQGTRARDLLRDGVQDALVALGQGFLSQRENEQLRDSLKSGALTERVYFQQLLRLVYRLIFLITAEERDLLFSPDASDAAKKLYGEGYGLRRLRERSVRGKAHDRFVDFYEGLKIVFCGLEAGQPVLGLPALAGLFSAAQTPALDGARLENHSLLTAVFRLSWIREAASLSRVNWRDMGPEELGSVYESLLELVPVLTNEGRVFGFASLDESKGNARKTTGSYYTPDSLVQVLLDSALEPVVQRTLAANPGKPVEALLALSIVDPACGSGHFLLAAARRLAAHVARLEANGTPSPKEYRHALRLVVGRCIFGVDLNPMAIELCRLALWMEAVEPGKPLSFLDSHLQQGNALLGATPELMKGGIPDDAWVALEGDDKKAAAALKKRNKKERDQDSLLLVPPQGEVASLTAAVKSLDEASDSDASALSKKQTEWGALLESVAFQHQKLVADAWCAAFVWPKEALPSAVAEAAPTNETWRQVRDEPTRAPTLTIEMARRLAREYEFFHWHLQFPQVFAKGGFDVILGNPPWEKIHLRDEEFFSEHSPDIVNAATKAIRKRMIEALKTENPALFGLYLRTQRHHDGLSGFCRQSGLFPLTGLSRINLYSLFCEAATRMVATSGRFGLVLPSGLLTDDNNKALFETLVDGARLVHAWDFENSRAIFPGVHRSYKFALICSGGPALGAPLADFAFHLQAIDHLKDPDRHFTLSSSDLQTLNPNTKSCPTFRNKKEAQLSLGVYRTTAPVCISPATTDWPGTIRTPFNTANDSALFETLSALRAMGARLDENNVAHKGSDAWLPVYEGKLVHQFNHRFAQFGEEHGETVSEVPDDELSRPDHAILPRYWIQSGTLEGRFPGPWFLLVRNITGALNERTAIAAIIPKRPAVDSANIIMGLEARAALVVCASMNSLVYDYFARQKIAGVHFNQFIWKQLPLIPPGKVAEWIHASHLHRDWLCDRALELTYTAWDLEPFARDVSYDGPPFRWDAARRFLLRCELDAAFFHLYGLSHEDAAYILDTFPIVKKNDEKIHGEYRTKRVILERYDAFAEATRSGRPYQTIVSPPPADPAVAHPDTRKAKRAREN